MKKKTIAFLAILAFFLTSVSALPTLREALPGLTDEQYQALMNADTVEMETDEGDDITALAPEGSHAQAVAAEAMQATQGFTVATCAFVPYPEDWKAMSQEQRQVEIFNRLRAISTLEGLTYISHRAGDKEKVLFNKTYSLEDPDKRSTKYPDPIVDTVPPRLTAYAYLNDTTFDGQIYQLDYTNSEEEIYLALTNYRALHFKGIKVLNAKSLRMSVSTWQTEEGIVVNTMATCTDHDTNVHILWWNVSLTGAFKRRVRALCKWFWGNVTGDASAAAAAERAKAGLPE